MRQHRLGRTPLRLGTPPARPSPVAGGDHVCLVLPAHDEERRIAAVVARLPDIVAGLPTRCLVIDDGSTDGTAAEAERAGATVLRTGRNHGLGAAVRTGLRVAVERGAAVVAFCDADGEYDPAELPALVAPIVDGSADYVVGSRFAGTIRGMRMHRRIGNAVLTAWVSWTVRRRVTDGQSGYRALSRRAAGDADIAHDYNYAQVLTIDLLGNGFAYAEVPISYRFRRGGRSFVRLPTYLRNVVPAVAKQLRRSCAATGASGAVAVQSQSSTT